MKKFTKFRARRGFAMIFVILIALAMIIPALILASSTIPRRTAVTGEAVSDRVLALGDATVDKILTQINTFPFPFTTPSFTGQDSAVSYLVGYYISQLNGGVTSTTDPVAALDVIKANVSTFLYNLDTQTYYVLWDGATSNVKAVASVGPQGDVLNSKVKDLSTDLVLENLLSVDSNFLTDNLWVEIDTNSDYWVVPDNPDQWTIKLTAYSISKPEIKRTIEAIASRGNVSTNYSSTGDYLANGNWYTHNTSTTTVSGHNFADYSGLYATKVYFGQYETTNGMIRSNQDLYMGGWAHDPIYASVTVNDDAVDAPGFPNNNTGKFGPDQNNLTWAKAHGYATNNYPAAQFPEGAKALFGTNPLPKPTDSGLQDQAVAPYYVSGNATVAFSVAGGVGKVTINGTMYDIPTNGAIYVEGTATVYGTVKGQCTVGAGVNINIGGNIKYNTPPRLDRNTPIDTSNTDLLGLIANYDILIPNSTFINNHHLEIDAAMLAVNGNFGIGSSYSYHPINGTGTYEAWWNGAQATFKTDNAPAMVSGSSVKGYDIQHTNYDWNLYDVSPPPFYPATGNTGESTSTVDNYPAVLSTNPDLTFLHNLTKGQLDPSHKLTTPIDAGGGVTLYYKYNYNGTDYYYGNVFNWNTTGTSATATIQSTALYRITWKEQISETVKP